MLCTIADDKDGLTVMIADYFGETHTGCEVTIAAPKCFEHKRKKLNETQFKYGHQMLYFRCREHITKRQRALYAYLQKI